MGRPSNLGDKPKLFAEQGGRCYLCQREMYLGRVHGGKPPRNYATIDHVVPLALGGANNASNRRLACRECNVRKAAMPLDKFLAKPVRRMSAESGDVSATFTGV